MKTETEAQRARERALRDNRGAMTEMESAVVDIESALTTPGPVGCWPCCTPSSPRPT